MKEISRRNFFQTTGLAAAVPALGAIGARAAQVRPPDVRVETDVVFGKGGDMDLRLDIYHPPAGTEKRMATLHVHGGGFAGGSKASVGRTAVFFAGQGYISIGSQYRLSGQARWPAQLHDVKAAIRWVRANADRLNIDAGKIAVAGYSAGGLMALFAAGTQDRTEFDGEGGNPGVSTAISAAVGYYPATSTPGNLLPEDSDEASRNAANLTNYIGANFAPTILFHGVDDTTIRLENSQSFFQMLRDAGVPAELHAYEGVPHVFDSHPEFALSTARLADLFFDRHVINPRTYPPFGGGGGRGRGRGGA